MGNGNFTLTIVVDDELAPGASGELHLVTSCVWDNFVLTCSYCFA